jgi:hypothetical protein
MRRSILQRLLIVFFLLAGPALGQTAQGWQPQNSWAFVVGVLEWKDAQTWAPFPKRNRRDDQLVQALLKLGLPREHIVVLQDQKATHDAIEHAFQSTLAQTAGSDTLFVYYAGHGYRDEAHGDFYMVPYDGYENETLWSLHDLALDLDQHFQGKRVILSADCCHSGSLGDYVAKGGHKVPYAAFCSSSSKLASTGNWTFSDDLLDLLTGNPAADLDGDGYVSLAEGGKLIASEMKFAEDQSAGLTATSDFGAAEHFVSTSRRLRSDEGKLAMVRYEGEDWKARILERKGNQVLVRWLGDPDDSPDQWVEAKSVKVLKGL